MPLKAFYHFPDYTSWCLWIIDESEEGLKSQLDVQANEPHSEYHEINHPVKRLEWLASRLAIQHLMGTAGNSYHGIFKDSCGKPHLVDSRGHISLAHCYPYAVAALNTQSPVGIDIERPRPKLVRIAPRFLSQDELKAAGTDPVTLCKYWSGKEALYKVYGRKNLIFKQDISLKRMSNSENFQGWICNQTDEPLLYNVEFQILDGHVVAISSENLK